jgi:hypothetical protein
MWMATHLSEGGGPCFTVSLCDKILDFGNTVLHFREEVTFANVLHHVLVDFVWVVVASKLLLKVSDHWKSPN